MNAPSASVRAHLNVEPLEQRCLPSSSSYVSSLYTNLLGRPGSAPEVAGYAALLDVGVPAGQVTNAFVSSTEYLSNEVQNDYQVILQRTPSPAEVQGWVNLLENGLGEQELKTSFLDSPECFALHGNDDGNWVKAVYPTVLGRDPSTAELTAWTGLLQHGLALQTAAQDIVMSPEAAARQVTTAYQQLLGRAPDPVGLANWSALLENGLPPAQLNARIAASSESIALQGGLDAIVVPSGADVPVPPDTDPPTGNVDSGSGFIDLGPCPSPIPDVGSTSPDTSNTGYDPGSTSYDSGSTSDTSYDPGSSDNSSDWSDDSGDSGCDY